MWQTSTAQIRPKLVDFDTCSMRAGRRNDTCSGAWIEQRIPQGGSCLCNAPVCLPPRPAPLVRLCDAGGLGGLGRESNYKKLAEMKLCFPRVPERTRRAPKVPQSRPRVARHHPREPRFGPTSWPRLEVVKGRYSCFLSAHEMVVSDAVWATWRLQQQHTMSPPQRERLPRRAVQRCARHRPQNIGPDQLPETLSLES